MTLKLVLFDMDGVIFRGKNFWIDLHRLYGTEGEAVSLADRYLRSDYPRMAEFTASVLWQGRAAAPLFELVASREYQQGIREVMDYLRGHGVITAIISSGAWQLAERAQKELGFHFIFANRLNVEGGVLTGELDLLVDDTKKGIVAQEAIKRADATSTSTAAVGDSVSDLSVAAEVSFFVAYEAEEEVQQRADWVCPSGSLLPIIDVLRSLIDD